MRRLLLCMCLLGLLFGNLGAQNLGDHDIISIEKSSEVLEKIKHLNLDILMEKDGKIFVVAGVKDLIKLNQELIPFAIETLNFPPYSQGLMSIQGGINGDFHSYLEVETELLALQEHYPQLAQVSIIGVSLENRNIYAIKISDNVSLNENEAELVFTGCHHAREWISVDVPLLIAKHLIENYGSDPEIRSLVDECEIWIVPLVNPDGLEYSIHTYRYWRKNRRDNGDGTYGVDLNRNYSYQWGLDDEGSSPNTFSGVYRGTAPFSEPESQAIRDFVSAHNFLALISYHNYSQIILYPWGYTPSPADEDETLEYLASNMAAAMESVHGRVYGYAQGGADFYLVNGDTTDWALGEQGIPAFTIELPPPRWSEGGFFNSEDDIQPIFEENLQASLFLIEWAIDTFNDQSQTATTSVMNSLRRLKSRHTKGRR